MAFLDSYVIQLLTFSCIVRIGKLQTDQGLLDLTETFWDWKLRQFPEFATRDEFHDHDDQLEAYSLNAYTYRKNNCTLFLKLAETIDTSDLSTNDRLTLDVLKDQLKTYINGYEWRMYGSLTPVNFLEGIHRDNRYWVEEGKYRSAEDFDKYLLRLERIPQQIKEAIALMENAIAMKRTSHRVSVEEVPVYIDEQITNKDAKDTIFYGPFVDHLEQAITEGRMQKRDRKHFRSRGEDVIRTSVQEAFRNLSNFITTRYLPNSREKHGVSSLENGMNFYKAALAWHLSVNMDPFEVHQLGLKEVKRIRHLIETVIRRQNFTGTLPEFFDHMRKKYEFYNHTEEEILAHYQHILHDRVAPKLPQFFINLTKIPLVKVERMPYNGIDAQYYDGTFYANTNLPQTRPSFVMTALALHEANPGHHLQVSLNKILPIPKFRRYLWGGKKYSAPFHFPYYTAYVEGWGLYAEFLGEEMGLYDNDYDLFGRYTFEIFRACRLVIDTGIHAYGWTREEGIEYMLNHTFTTRKQATTEVDRYITWPGQACAYKVGEIHIKRLRKKAEAALGDKFDIRQFHWEVIRLGFVPLKVLDDSIERWITSVLGNTSGIGTINHSASTIMLSLMFLQLSRSLLMLK